MVYAEVLKKMQYSKRDLSMRPYSILNFIRQLLSDNIGEILEVYTYTR